LFGSLKSEPDWVGSLNHQPVVGRTGSNWVTCFDSSNWNLSLFHEKVNEKKD